VKAAVQKFYFEHLVGSHANSITVYYPPSSGFSRLNNLGYNHSSVITLHWDIRVARTKEVTYNLY
jgi:hypothetical protein